MKQLLLLTMLFGLFSCSKGELGTKGNPIQLYFTPSVDSSTITSNSSKFIEYLEKETGLYFKSAIPSSYVAVVEAFGSSRADIAVMNSFGYLLANSKYGAEARLRVLRHGSDVYYGMIITRNDSGIKDIKDLNEKKFAFTDSSSTSGYMLPLKMMNDQGVKLGNTTFAIKHDSVVTMVYQKQVDAGAAFYSKPSDDGTINDARARVKAQFPDAESQIKILAITDSIPNDPFVFRKDLSPEITNKFITALKKYLSTDDGKQIFKNIYSVDGVVDSSNSDYDVLRKVIQSIGADAESLLKTAK